MKAMKGRVLKKLRSIPQLGHLKKAPRVLRVNASDGLSSLPPTSPPSLRLEPSRWPSSPGRALRELPVRSGQQQEAKQGGTPGVPCKAPSPPAEPDVIDVAELMRGLEDDYEEDDDVGEISNKENIRPGKTQTSSSRSRSRGPPLCCPSTTPEHIDGSPFRRPDPDSASLFDPDLLAAFEQAVMDHIRPYEELRSSSRATRCAAACHDLNGLVEEKTKQGVQKEGDDEEQPPSKLPRTRKAADGEEEGDPLRGFELRCPPGGVDAVVLYTTSLRGIRKTFEDCSSMRLLLGSLRVRFYERDVSMHLGYREELWAVLGGRAIPPRLFVRGRYIGGADEVVGLHERGQLLPLLRGLPVDCSGGTPCRGCGGVGFVLCGQCSGSRKVVGDDGGEEPDRCPACNENGLLVCAFCSWSSRSSACEV